MRLVLLLSGCMLSFLWCVGCQNNRNGPKSIEVVIDDGEDFPEFLVGKWQADRSYWELDFALDGRITSAAIGLGGVEMKPGEISEFTTKSGGKGIFEPGGWFVHYNSETRELLVKIVVKHFYMDVGKYALEGNTTDILLGPVSEDGKKWEADWFSSGQYIGLIPDPNIFYDVNEDEPESRGQLFFEKVEQED